MVGKKPDEILSKKIDCLRTIGFHLPFRNKENIISFIRGYDYGKEEDKRLSNFMKAFMKKEYNIDSFYNSWEEQIDHYSFEQKINWEEGFHLIVRQICNSPEWQKNEIKGKKSPIIFKEIDSKNVAGRHLILDKKITIGQIIQLTDKIGQGYKKTKFFDSKLKNPSWNLFYPSENDFNFVRFKHQKKINWKEFIEHQKPCTYGNVWRIFSGIKLPVEAIHIKDDKYFAHTSIFEIELEKALISNEIQLLEEYKDDNRINHLANNLNEHIANYRLGLLPYDCIEELLGRWLKNNFEYLEKDWYNFNQSINGKWTKTNR